MGRYRVTVDTGGTFSDFVYLDEDTDEITVAKIPSTPDDPSRAILAGIERLIGKGVAPTDIRYFCHGTTVGTNALLEGKGVRTGLLVTQGFRGIYEVQEQSRPHGPTIFDIMYDKPPLLAPASQTGEVRERVTSSGETLIPLDEAQIRAEARRLGKSGVESIAVCLLFSFLKPEHEARVRAIIAEEIPGCSVSLSSEIVPQIREYYRLSTTVINAYLQPILARYIANLDDRLNGAGVATPQKYIMQSNGGMSTFAATAKKAVATVLSGPAGGVTASLQACRTTGFQNLITFDMGGTSCDVALIKDGEPSLSNRGKIEGRDIALPMIDINTVSAGGGTLARVDRFGTLEVGPESAGAQPGPACYGRGGEQPTITDCNLVLGYLSPDNFLGGQMTLDRVRAHLAVESHVAQKLDMDVPAAAEGIVRIINVKMQEAIKAISTMRGHDLREFMLLAFGGAGPLHAGRIAADLGMAGVIVPPFPGVYSAMGLVMSDVKHDYIRSRLSPLANVTEGQINAIFDYLGRLAREDLAAEHFAEAQIRIEPALDMRYAGQGYEITVPCDALLQPGAIRALRQRFDELHKESFGHTAPDEPVEIVSYRLRGVGLVPPVKIPTFEPTGAKLADALRETRKAQFDGQIVDCPVYQREKLDVGATFIGPAIIDQLDCTTVLFPGHVARVDAYRNIIMTVQEA
ncbi:MULTISPECIES: hydantoinase/oxoprolinase family protein [unclassified Beijerinckia]|uniref:hydantoinase/oxoprolinase family protein n=1 Tax=unclassified Beijerinckia TaxID=2638183 RepID=UPI0008998F93|nr:MULTISPECIES: hydantoinase/oxoprolinase family protein [unclassified Beijerinckia]MDH7795332.1 N-methylhydantoinase A [Beijerinckia sp. GAS462]SEB97144.1 N-methylhydantoinase A [Beijerinckia sp. 28-YEA-48]